MLLLSTMVIKSVFLDHHPCCKVAGLWGLVALVKCIILNFFNEAPGSAKEVWGGQEGK